MQSGFRSARSNTAALFRSGLTQTRRTSIDSLPNCISSSYSSSSFSSRAIPKSKTRSAMIQRKQTRPPQPFEEQLTEQRAHQPPAHLLSGVKQIVVRFGSGPEKPILVTLNKEIKRPIEEKNPRTFSTLFPLLMVVSLMYFHFISPGRKVAASLEGKYTSLLAEHCSRNPAFVSLVRLLFRDHTRLAVSNACFIESKNGAGQTVCYYVWHPTTRPPSPPPKPGASFSLPPSADLVLVLKIVLRNPTERTPSFTVARTSVSIRQKGWLLYLIDGPWPSGENGQPFAYPWRWLRNSAIGPKLDSGTLKEYAQGKGKKK